MCKHDDKFCIPVNRKQWLLAFKMIVPDEPVLSLTLTSSQADVIWLRMWGYGKIVASISSSIGKISKKCTAV